MGEGLLVDIIQRKEKRDYLVSKFCYGTHSQISPKLIQGEGLVVAIIKRKKTTWLLKKILMATVHRYSQN